MRMSVVTPRGAVALRPTLESDADAYCALRLESLQAHPEAFGVDYATSAARPRAYWEQRMRQGARGDHGVTYVAEAGGALIGMTALERHALPKTRHSARISGVYLTPAWRGMGVGAALLRACLAHGQALGLQVVRLGVATTNGEAIRLYVREALRSMAWRPSRCWWMGRRSTNC